MPKEGDSHEYAKVMKVFEDIRETIGLTQYNLTVSPSYNVTSVSYILESKGKEIVGRYLLFNPTYVKGLKEDTVLYGMMSHELAHHLYDHSLNNDTTSCLQDELIADEYAGYVLGHLCTSKTTSLSCLNIVKEESNAESPDSQSRETHMNIGWLKGKASCLSGSPEEMVLVEGGRFTMGDELEQGACGEESEIPHEVYVSSFYLSKYEVCFSEDDAFCDSTIYSRASDKVWGRGDRPVINVSWHNAVTYCNWLSEKEGLQACYEINSNIAFCDFTQNGYRLPTEAEWEYAAREGGKRIRFGNGKNTANPSEMNFFPLGDCPYNIIGNYRKQTAPVNTLTPNRLGLYHMSGNVAEWCWDWYKPDYDEKGVYDNPKGPTRPPMSGRYYRIVRGGHWGTPAQYLQVTSRANHGMFTRFHGTGFRLCRSLP